MSSTRNELDKSVVKKMELVLNRYLKRYDWFEKIELETVGYSPSQRVSHFAPVGTIYVDGDWLYERWREYYHEGPFPDLYDEELGVSLGDFIGGDFSEKLRGEFTTIFAGVTGYLRPKYVSWSWLKVRIKDDETQNLRESIRRVLKESNIKNRLENLIDKVGLTQACKSVGGINYLSKALGVNKVELIQKYFIGKKLSTEDIEDIGVGVGGYDFDFKIVDVTENDEERLLFEIVITKGKVTLIAGNGETYDLMDGKVKRKDFWWEIEYEMLDLFTNYSHSLLEEMKYEEDIEDMLSPHIEFYFIPSI